MYLGGVDKGSKSGVTPAQVGGRGEAGERGSPQPPTTAGRIACSFNERNHYNLHSA